VIRAHLAATRDQALAEMPEDLNPTNLR
jgi:hypothetical protein